jgi:hypothetical protein
MPTTATNNPVKCRNMRRPHQSMVRCILPQTAHIASRFFPTRTLVQIASKQRMGRNRLYSKAWRCELRLGHKDGGHFFAGLEILHKLDAVMRRASSVAKFAIRFEAVSERRELLLRIAAVRHEATDRADSAVIPILRFFPKLEKGILAAFVRRVSYAGVHEL